MSTDMSRDTVFSITGRISPNSLASVSCSVITFFKARACGSDVYRRTLIIAMQVPCQMCH